MFRELKITNILKSSDWGLVKSELPWEQNFYSPRCVSCRTISLPSFNGLRCKLTKIALFIAFVERSPNADLSRVYGPVVSFAAVFWDVTQCSTQSFKVSFGGALRDIPKNGPVDRGREGNTKKGNLNPPNE